MGVLECSPGHASELVVHGGWPVFFFCVPSEYVGTWAATRTSQLVACHEVHVLLY